MPLRFPLQFIPVLYRVFHHISPPHKVLPSPVTPQIWIGTARCCTSNICISLLLSGAICKVQCIPCLCCGILDGFPAGFSYHFIYFKGKGNIRYTFDGCKAYLKDSGIFYGLCGTLCDIRQPVEGYGSKIQDLS